MDISQSIPSAPPASSVLFARGVIARLAVWSTLRVAVQENWGGSEGAAKRTWLASVIVDTFEEQPTPPDDQYIEEMLLQVMADEFEAIVEDGSAESVAQDIVRLWDETRVGTQELVVRFEELADRMKGKKSVVQVKEDEEGEWTDEDCEDDDDGDEEEVAPQLLDHSKPRAPREEPEIDEDGFTLVKGKGRR